MNGNGNGNSVWKWVAGVVVAVMIAGAPGYLALISRNSPTRDEFQVVVDRQQTVLQRLASVETKLTTIEQDLQEGHATDVDLQKQLNDLRLQFQSLVNQFSRSE